MDSFTQDLFADFAEFTRQAAEKPREPRFASEDEEVEYVDFLIQQNPELTIDQILEMV